MKTKNVIFSLVAVFALVTQLVAQDIPKPSPSASVSQTVGLTDITIDYSSPGVKGRELWGKLVPYNELWRTGANKATSITFSKPVEIKGTTVPAGSYSLLTIPGKDEWTVVLNKETELWGTGGYDKAKDVLRFQVKPESAPMRERLAFMFSDFDEEKATVALEWGKLRVPFTVNVNTDEQAMASIKSTLDQSWRPYTNAARYLLENDKNLDQALEYVNTSISLKNEWLNNFVKAQILAKQGEYKDAIKSAKTAKELGDKSDNFYYKERVEQAIEEYKKKK